MDTIDKGRIQLAKKCSATVSLAINTAQSYVQQHHDVERTMSAGLLAFIYQNLSFIGIKIGSLSTFSKFHGLGHKFDARNSLLLYSRLFSSSC